MSEAISVDSVTLLFGTENGHPVLALDDVSLDVPQGQFLAIVGPSGCGETTILNMLAGVLRPTLGSVKRNGEEVLKPSLDIGYMLARSALYRGELLGETSNFPSRCVGWVKRNDVSKLCNCLNS